MKNHKDLINKEISPALRQQIFDAVAPELEQHRQAQKSSAYGRLQFLGFLTAGLVAWFAGNRLLKENAATPEMQNDMLEFADLENFDDLELFADIDPDDMDFLLENEILEDEV